MSATVADLDDRSVERGRAHGPGTPASRVHVRPVVRACRGTGLAARAPMEIDVVCGMEVDPTDAPGESEYRGKIYYFCSADCLEAFEDDPDTFTARHTTA